MIRFSFPSAMMAFFVIALVAIAGTAGPTILAELARILKTKGFQQFAVVIATCCVAGVVSGLQRRMHNYGGRPPRADLLKLLLWPAFTVLAAIVLIGLIVAMLLTWFPVMSSLAAWAMNASFALNVASIIAAIWIAVQLINQYRTTCAWEDSVHPLHKGC